MELKEFVLHFAEQFEDTDIQEFTADTKFHQLEEWSSLALLSIIAMANEEYDIILKGDDFKKAETIEDLYIIIKEKM